MTVACRLDRTDILTDQKWDKVIQNANVKENGTKN
jgi:hypothetical protein